MSRNLKSLRDFISKSRASTQTFERDHAIYPFWSLKFNASSTVRLLPDGNVENQAPWVAKKIIPTTFVDPENDSKTVHFQVPCREMYGPEKCPALEPVRALYREAKALTGKGNTLEGERVKKVASRHWIDATFYHAALVRKNGFVEEQRPADATPIRVLPFTKQVQGVIETSLGLNTDENAPPSQFSDDELPCGSFNLDDVKRVLSGEISDDEIEAVLARFKGYPFVIVKKQKGEHANYESSFFHMKEPDELTPDDLQLIAEHGLPDLSKYLPKQPTDEQYKTLTEIVEASIAQEPWDPAWEAAGFKFFRKKDRDGAKDGEAGGNSILARVKSNLPSDETEQSPASSLAAAMSRRKATVTPTTVTIEAETTPEATVETQPEEAKSDAPIEGKRDPKALAAALKNKIAPKN